MVLDARKIERVDEIVAGLDAHDYLADEGLATVVLLGLRMQRPLFLEGEPGAGKTEVARALSRWTGGRLIRMQCYEGIDAAQALYEWDHARQLLHLRATEAADATGKGLDALESELYAERFLIRRPLLDAIATEEAPVPILLIDEVDRADDEFEAFLLEVLADYQITVPELGTFTATTPPVVVITSNRTRDVHDALKRRCLYHWVEQPSFEREVAIIRRRVPAVSDSLARQVAALVVGFREANLYKPPGVAESIDFAHALATLGVDTIDASIVDSALGSVVKYREDGSRLRRDGLEDLVSAALERAG